MYQSEKNFLEKLASYVPGLKGYREKEDRRETDKRLREFMGAELDRDRRALEALKRQLLAESHLDLLDDVDRVGAKLQRAADSIRYASYGYAGLFDQVKIQEKELDKLYEYDGDLLARVKEFSAMAATTNGAADPAKAIAELGTAAEALLTLIDGRKQIFNLPS